MSGLRMKRRSFGLLVFLSVSACTHTWEVDNANPEKIESLEIYNSAIPDFIEVSVSPLAMNEFRIQNKLDKTLYVSFEHSSVIYGQISARAISGETRLLHSDRISPDQPIAPKTSGLVMLFPEGLSKKDYSQIKTNGGKFRIAVRPDKGDLSHFEIHTSSCGPDPIVKKPRVSAKVSKSDRFLCGITAGIYCAFMKPNNAEAENIALKLYGSKDIKVLCRGNHRTRW